LFWFEPFTVSHVLSPRDLRIEFLQYGLDQIHSCSKTGYSRQNNGRTWDALWDNCQGGQVAKPVQIFPNRQPNQMRKIVQQCRIDGLRLVVGMHAELVVLIGSQVAI
jgi:RNAse (barnase) inhibitor barstar